MSVADPVWLLLLFPLGYFALLRKVPLVRPPFRLLALLFLILALSDFQIRDNKNGTELLLLLDQSDSARNAVQLAEKEVLHLLGQGRGEKDLLTVIDFAKGSRLRAERLGSFEDNLNHSRIASAIRHALSIAKADHFTRILLLTDGASTESLDGLASLLADSEAVLDYRFVSTPGVFDARAELARIPKQVLPGEPFLIDMEAEAGGLESVQLQLYRDGTLLRQSTLSSPNGLQRFRFSDRLFQEGIHHYRLHLKADGDEVPQNNFFDAYVSVHGGNRVMLITAYPNDPLATLLHDNGLPVETVTDPVKLHPARLQGVGAVLLNNVPASKIPAPFLEALHFYVRGQGGGLMMLGGKQSFGTGGFFRSPIDSLLPVSMELREDQRRISTAYAYVLDRSGSMGVASSDGRTKMELVNEGTALSIELLAPSDHVTVLAVDSEPHVVCELSLVGDEKDSLINAVRHIDSGGGGIYVYNGLNAAWSILRESPLPRKHILLFSDAADSEQPGDYQNLIEEIRRGGGSISVIAMGGRMDTDAQLLEEIARLGDGQIYFAEPAYQIPAMFSQETVRVTRSAFFEETFAVSPTARWHELAPGSIRPPASVDAYNLCWPRERASVALLNSEDKDIPLLAWWNFGSGKTAAVCFPVSDSKYPSVLNWTDAPDFLQTLTRWLRRPDAPDNLMVNCKIDGDEALFEMIYSEAWHDDFAKNAPKLYFGSVSQKEPEELKWTRKQSGIFHASTRVEPGVAYTGSVVHPKFALPIGPYAAGSSPEWKGNTDKIKTLERMARASGGQERFDLSEIWKPTRKASASSLRPLFTLIATLLFLIECLLSRFRTFKHSSPEDGEVAEEAVASENPLMPAAPKRRSKTKDALPNRKSLFEQAKKK